MQVISKYFTTTTKGLFSLGVLLLLTMLNTHSVSATPVPLSADSRGIVIDSNTSLILSSSPSFSNLTVNRNSRQISGYAWSSDIGWINFSSGVTMLNDGSLTGMTLPSTYTNGVNFNIDPSKIVRADANGNLYGYAWSLDVGWLHFNGQTATVLNTGGVIDLNKQPMRANVTIDNITGQMSGYGWNRDMGWVNFSGVQVQPNGRLQGQATALNTGATLNFSSNNANVTVANNGAFSGYAWSTDFGWVNFAGVTTADGRFPIKFAPGKVTNLQLSPSGAGQISLTWTAPVNDGGSAITDYKIEYCQSDMAGNCSSAWQEYADGISTATQATVSGLSAGGTQSYAFRVSARNAVGYGEASAVAVAKAGFISLSVSNSALSIGVTPFSNGKFSSATHNVLVNGNLSAGMTLRLSMTGSDNALRHGTLAINATSATATAPTVSMDDNSWGYRVNNPKFGMATTIETNIDDTSYKWARVQPSGSADEIYKTTAPLSFAQTIPVYYGLKVKPTIPAGAYSGSVRYELIAN